MKRFMAAVVVLAVLGFSGVSWAAGSVTVSRAYSSEDGKVLVIKCACVGDSSNGSIPNTLISGSSISAFTDPVFKTINDFTKAGFYLYEVKVVTGATKPDAADVYLIEAVSGNTLFAQTNLIPAVGTAYGTFTKYPAIMSGVSLWVVNQSTASATYTIYLTFVR